MHFNESFKYILQRRQMTLANLADRTHIDYGLLENSLSDKFDLSDEQVEIIAEALAVPPRTLFGTVDLPLSNIPDFRRKTPSPSLLEPTVLKAIGYVEKISLSLASLDLDLSLSDEVEKYSGEINKRAARDLAAKWRLRWGISEEEQLQWRDSGKLYSSLRSYIEGLGVFVVHYSFGTDEVAGLYAKVDDGPHTILVNTSSSSKARKLFTLAHEFCHVLLRKNGISDHSITRNKIEIFCNQFAAYLLAPASIIEKALKRYKYNVSINNESIRLLAKNLGISQQACVLRLVDIRKLNASDYMRWISRFKGRIPDGDRADIGAGSTEPDPIKNKRTQYGSSLLSKLAAARRNGLLDAIEIYRLAGIKPKYQRELLGG
jgi:Zn-dependent peptidase ImmA (M78 family)/lambda repressor-like predicted transcriptional regulator